MPYMAAPEPEINIEQLRDLFSRQLRIYYSVGDSASIIQRARELAQIQGSVFSEPDFEAHCMLSIFEDHEPVLEINIHIDQEPFDNLLRSLQIYATMVGEKWFAGLLNVVDPFMQSKRKQASEREIQDFFDGERAALISELPTINFVFGIDQPKRPDFREILAEIQKQF